MLSRSRPDLGVGYPAYASGFGIRDMHPRFRIPPNIPIFHLPVFPCTCYTLDPDAWRNLDRSWVLLLQI